MNPAPIGWAALAYLAGSIPASYLAGRLAGGIDLRRLGSGNLGATNVVRALGWGWAVPVALFDISKGFVPVLVLRGYFGADLPGWWAAAIGFAAILGHVFPVWMRFRGGKGIATTLGVFAYLAPEALAGSVAVWLALVLTTRYVSLGSIAAVGSLPLFVALTDGGERSALWLAAAVVLLCVWLHRANIARLRSGTENRFGKGAG